MLKHNKYNPAIIQGKKTLDIGCGRAKLNGAVGLDSSPYAGVDIVADLNKPLPIEDETYEVVHANQVLEHVHNLIGLMNEIHRILKPGGILVAHTPYFRSSWAHIDPTHVRSFTINTLDYFVKGNFFSDEYSFGDRFFSQRCVYLDNDYISTPQRVLMIKLALRWPFRFENSVLSFICPFEQITYVLTK